MVVEARWMREAVVPWAAVGAVLDLELAEEGQVVSLMGVEVVRKMQGLWEVMEEAALVAHSFRYLEEAEEEERPRERAVVEERSAVR